MKFYITYGANVFGNSCLLKKWHQQWLSSVLLYLVIGQSYSKMYVNNSLSRTPCVVASFCFTLMESKLRQICLLTV